MIPSMPMISVNVSRSLAVIVVYANRAYLTVSRKNSIDRLIKINCSARFFLSAPKNIMKVKSPHMKKYAMNASLLTSHGVVNP